MKLPSLHAIVLRVLAIIIGSLGLLVVYFVALFLMLTGMAEFLVTDLSHVNRI